MIQDYLETRADLLGLMILIDSRHEPTKDDQAMYEYAQYLNLPLLIVLTKVDKLKKNAANRAKQQLGRTLDLSADNVTVQTFSAVTGEGRTEVLDWIETHLA
jgi:GTP-binding protein